ncbi:MULTISPECIES: hypothetical protein [unclassified Pseudoalteromonas]|uniref:HNH endonuclease n=1 Tax=unclassified Pseudoalteromonas TaxID=194690 RepID=UPI0025B54C3B|nr:MULTISPECIES: hypothetical protein [unclassified Pseudoalteromonas]MDN3377962.1 hypothetical protein [Pseudoalteromonas sp. APC 3893]MDN3386728.1 hypothetical protein [Pseudoalteromonas sp. APC 4017]
MIKIIPVKCPDLTAQYKKFVVAETLVPSIDKLAESIHDKEVRKRLITYFSTNKLESITFEEAQNLHLVITDTYEKFPELLEYYCPELFLTNLKLNYNLLEIEALKLTAAKEKAKINVLFETTLKNLNDFFINNPSSFLEKSLKLNRRVNRKASEKRDALVELSNLKHGKTSLSKGLKFIPLWVIEFSKVFKYDIMAQKFGYELINELKISVCPYCNQEDITSIFDNDARYRPAFDHFYPKSKFPFLATTLSNLIPAGERCNERYKASVSTLGYANPYDKSIDYQKPFFKFNIANPNFYDKNLELKDVEVELIIRDESIKKNSKLFKLETIYNEDKFKNEFLKVKKKYNFIKECGGEFLDLVHLSENDHEKIDLHFGINIKASPRNENLQVLKIDSLNMIAKSKIRLNE